VWRTNDWPTSNPRWHTGRIQTAMNEGCQRQEILGVCLVHGPMDARGMRCRISEHSEDALDKVGEAALLASLALGAEIVDRQHWKIATERTIDENGSIVSEASAGAQLVSDALGGLQDGMKIIVRHQFSSTKAQHVRVDAARRQVILQ